MFKSYILSLILIALALVTTAAAQEVYTPAKDSPERKAILNALRAPVEKVLKKKTIFAVQTFNVQGNWAFLIGTPQKSDGSQMDYRDTIYQENINNGVFDDSIVALLKKSGATWKVVQYVIGPTDVVYATWWKNYKAPKAIFPHME